jgi:hypothetical protein
MLRLTAFILNIPKRMLRGGAHDESASENESQDLLPQRMYIYREFAKLIVLQGSSIID